ncbi:hypothetical protein DU292_24920 [Escherichia coli]|jgi:hypothetical protein|uniref:Uncharacterized protein n=1 Tax=Escherichia coli TaxID=562 RepID=A0A5P0JFK9_ECOLX|nr:hypothetical protein [Escherichia coli]KDU07002.1 hypothetical protein AC58_4348 [Escherichia coli 3-105-05_S3_C3]KDX84637.1 hypothetical protein AC46_3853 [Escherichia coli 2-222-05_S3_C3]KEJ11935.1 hypothetical protein AD07_2190 [Escherichia coli 8-415-05_S4_C2]KEJ17087.1 hypothetical protein AC79_0274 [Escherichia coli 8-415-05_S4_C1]KEJ35564.1 hypothetical protein AD36_0388 [Escherichia coli 8-415-05_S4_C3]KEN35755.1 hypothetical protein AC54_0373 [Escherichia coli 8-415-05_S3_C3]KEN4
MVDKFTDWQQMLPALPFEISSRITFFLSGFSIIKNSGYYSSRKYLSTLTEALMLENVIIR